MGRRDLGSFAAFGCDAGLETGAPLKTGAPGYFAVNWVKRATSPAGLKAG